MITMRAPGRSLALALVLSLAACRGETTLAPLESHEGPASLVAIESCVAPATVVASTEADLRAALASARPGAVIAISGQLDLKATLEIHTTDITLTCSRPGDGLTTQVRDWRLLPTLIDVLATDVTIDGLVLDAPFYGISAIVAVTHDRVSLSRVAVRRSFARCGDVCFFFAGVDHATITDNYIEGTATAVSGIHLQRSETVGGFRYIDGSRVERNLVVAPFLIRSGFGGIRVRSGARVVVRDNRVQGQWPRGFYITELQDSEIENNVSDGAWLAGLQLSNPRGDDRRIERLLIRRNNLASAGNAVSMNNACGNVLVANSYDTPMAQAEIALGSSTGANVVLGGQARVLDKGSHDCDGDKQIDPNFVSGMLRNGSTPGEVIGPVMRRANGAAIE